MRSSNTTRSASAAMCPPASTTRSSSPARHPLTESWRVAPALRGGATGALLRDRLQRHAAVLQHDLEVDVLSGVLLGELGHHVAHGLGHGLDPHVVGALGVL